MREPMNVQPVTLAGRFIRLIPMQLDHVDALCEVGIDPDLWRFTVTRVQNPEDMRKYVTTALDLQREGSALPFVTVLKSSNKIVGSSRFGNIDRANAHAEIGWTWVAREWQRTPVNTEAKYLMLKHAFETLGCLRVEFKTDSLNEKSRKALSRIGAKEEGIFRNHMLVWDERIRDTVWFSIIDSEWPQVKADLQYKLSM